MASSGQPKVLVVGIAATLTWLVTRCLARAGLRPVVMGFHPVSPIGLSPDCLRYVRLSGVRWSEHGELGPELVQQIDRACAEHAIDVVVAADRDAALLLSEAGGVRGVRLGLVPEAVSMRVLHDKWQLSRLMERLRLPYPATELASDAKGLEATALRFPIVTKPLAKWGGLGFQVHSSREALAGAIAGRRLSASFPLLVQEFVPGWDVGFSFLAREGALHAYTMFDCRPGRPRRFYEDPRLRAHVEALLSDARYSGVGHLDVRYDPAADEYRILELNPRFWASLLYALAAGVNYPALLVRADPPGGAPVRAARLAEVQLPRYERAMSLAMALTERWMWRAHALVTRWRGQPAW